MKNKNNAESLVWIIVWIFILSFVLIGIWNLIWNSKEMIWNFNDKMQLDILSKNTAQIITNLDTSIISDWDVFYVHKNPLSLTFDIYIWEHNNEYKYINKNWYKIDNPISYNEAVYTRTLLAKKINLNWEDKIAIKVLIKKLIK